MTAKEIKFERVWAMPNKNTFSIKPIKELLSAEVDQSKFWIDPFANESKIASVTNDMNRSFDTDYHLDALEFLKMFGDEEVDGVLYDPPFSPRQICEAYHSVGIEQYTTNGSFWSSHKEQMSRIIKHGGKAISFGWNSGGVGKKYGFVIRRILLVPHGGNRNDTICVVEEKI